MHRVSQHHSICKLPRSDKFHAGDLNEFYTWSKLSTPMKGTSCTIGFNQCQFNSIRNRSSMSTRSSPQSSVDRSLSAGKSGWAKRAEDMQAMMMLPFGLS